MGGFGHAGAQCGLGRQSPCAGAGAGEPLVVDVAPQGGDLAVAGGGGADELEQVCGPVVEPPGGRSSDLQQPEPYASCEKVRRRLTIAATIQLQGQFWTGMVPMPGSRLAGCRGAVGDEARLR